MMLMSFGSAAQSYLLRSELPDQFVNNHYLLNPANSDSAYSVSVRVGNKAETGLFQGINKIYVDGDWKVKTGSKGAMHHVGIFVFNNREGNFINRSRLYGRYSWRFRLSRLASLAAGASVGVINYSFRSSQAGVGGSDLAADGNIGLWYLRPAMGIGVSLQHLSSPELRPVNQNFKIIRYSNLIAFREFLLSPSLTVNTQTCVSIADNHLSRFAIAGIVRLYDKTEAGMIYLFPGHVLFMVGVKNLQVANCQLHLSFSYLVEAGRLTVRDNAIELFAEMRR